MPPYFKIHIFTIINGFIGNQSTRRLKHVQNPKMKMKTHTMLATILQTNSNDGRSLQGSSEGPNTGIEINNDFYDKSDTS